MHAGGFVCGVMAHSTGLIIACELPHAIIQIDIKNLRAICASRLEQSCRGKGTAPPSNFGYELNPIAAGGLGDLLSPATIHAYAALGGLEVTRAHSSAYQLWRWGLLATLGRCGRPYRDQGK